MNLSKLLVRYRSNVVSTYQARSKHNITCPPPKEPIVTVVNASTKIGRILSLLLKQNPMIGELRLYDKCNSICVVGEDLSHIDTKTKVCSFSGPSVLRHAVTDANIVVTVGGCKTSHRETEKEVFERNMDDVRLTALHMIEFNPKGVFCIAKPPVEALVPLVSEEYKKAGVYDSRRIIGVTAVGSMRANHFIASRTGQNASDVLCPIVGGLSSDCLVAVLSQARPAGQLHPKNYKIIQQAVSNGETDALKQYADCSTVCLTPALAVSRFIGTLLKALNGETNCVDCAFVRQTGHIGQFLPYMTSIVRLGRHGILSTHMPKISGEEAYLLKKASFIIQKYINMGESIVTGEIKSGKPCRKKDKEAKKVAHHA